MLVIPPSSIPIVGTKNRDEHLSSRPRTHGSRGMGRDPGPSQVATKSGSHGSACCTETMGPPTYCTFGKQPSRTTNRVHAP